MKRKMLNSCKIMSFLLSVLLILDSTGMYVTAANASDRSNFLTTSHITTGTADGNDVVSGGEVNIDDDISEGDFVSGNIVSALSDGDVVDDCLAYGTHYGMEWSISKKGELNISGTYDANKDEGTTWHEYASEITGAKVSAVKVKSMKDWFRNLTKLKTVDFTKFDSGSVRDANSLFYRCIALENIKLGSFDTTNMKDMGYMFYGCRKLENLDVSGFNTGKVTDMRYMFSGCTSLTTLAVGGFDTANVTNMTGMFQNCCNVAKLNVSKFDTANVTDMSYMFADCYSLKVLDVSGFNTANVTNMSSMFQNCSTVTELDVSKFDTTNVVHMSAMFYGCSSVTKLDVSSFDTDYVTNMTHMFSDCRELTEIVFGTFSTVRVTNMDYMFYKCYKLPALDLSMFYLVRLKSAENMLGHCGGLEQIKTPQNLKIEVALPFEMQDETGKRYTILPMEKYVFVTLQRIPYSAEAIPNQVYTGKPIKPEVVVVKDGEILTKGVDYILSYKYNKDVASVDEKNAPRVIVKGIGRYSGSFISKFNIVAKEITEKNVAVDEMILYANDKMQTPRPVVTVDGIKLTFNKDFVVEYPDRSEGAYREPGRYEVVIKGKCNYTGIYTAYVDILGENQIKASELTVDKIPVCIYTEDAPSMPLPAVRYKKEALILDKDYYISYENNDKPGKGTLIITGLKNEEGTYVSGTLKKTFIIKGKPLNQVAVSYAQTAVYTGNGIYPKVTLTDGEKTLRQGVDYTIEYVNNVNVGKAKIVLTGCGAYTGSVRKNFVIKPEEGVGDLLDIVVGDDGKADYTTGGSEPKVLVMLDEKVLIPDIDYTVYYQNNKKVAKANAMNAPTVIVKGKGNYKFSRKETFTIREKSLGARDITITVGDKYVGAKDLRSKPVVTDGMGNTLKQGEDYIIVSYKIGGVEYDPKNIPKDATRAIVTIKGKGGYTGEISAMYRIAEKNIAQTNVTAKNLEFTGEEVEYTPEQISLGKLVITDRKTNEELEYGMDYEIIGYKNNTKKGYATVIIKGLGNYGGTRNVKFRIVTTKIPL